MLIKEFEFQRKAVEELIEKVTLNLKGKTPDMLFTAPVASGKTVMAGQFMDVFYKENPDYAFVWLTPGIGELEEQSKNKIDNMSLGVKALTLDDLMVRRELHPGDALFANWEMLNEKNNAMKGGEKDSIQDVMDRSNAKVIALIDEAHHSAETEKSQHKLDVFNPELSIHITATPSKKFELDVQKVEVDIHDVIEMGLIKKQVIVNKDLESLEQKAILQQAMSKMAELKEGFQEVERGLDVPPLCLIQIANDTSVERDIQTKQESERIQEMLMDLGVDENKIAVKLAQTVINYANIDTSDVEYLIMKQAVATGWDCPRAHVLVRFRDVQTLTFDIQTIGRVLRTTEAKHYQSDLLDSAYIYTEFEHFDIDGDIQTRGRVITDKELIRIKPDAKTVLNTLRFPMQKRLRSTNIEISTQTLFDLLAEGLKIESLTIDESQLTQHITQGEIQTDALTDELMLTQAEYIKSNQRIKADFFNALSNVYSKYNLTRHVYRIIKQQMDDGKTDNDIYKLYLSNQSQINLQIQKAIEKLEHDFITDETSAHHYLIIEEVYYPETVDTSPRYPYIKKPNLSVVYTKSTSEDPFGHILDAHENVKYWYKNLEYGNHYSVAYTYDNYGETFIRLFFPDFIVLTHDGRVLILDTKAPTNEEDYPHVKEKYNASQQFLDEHLTDFKVDDVVYAPTISMVKRADASNDYFVCISDGYNTDVHDQTKWVKVESILKPTE